jgi:predicted alpha/beta hydrolase
VASFLGAAMAAVMPLAVVPPVLKEEGLEFGLMMQQMVRMQQIQMENQIQMQQTFLEQFVRCLPMNLGGTSSRLPSTVFQAPNLPVVSGPAACPPTVLDSSGTYT